jgi:transposase
MYQSDLKAKEWAMIEGYFKSDDTRGRKSRHNKKAIVDAILYLVKSGCQWRMMPKDFPPRDHWRIENTLHYVRDVTFGEDASRIRKHPHSFAQLRTFAFNSLRDLGFENMNKTRQIMAWREDALKNLFIRD